MDNSNDTDVFNQKLLLQEDKYVDFQPLKIFCGTFNVAAQDPSENLGSWLNHGNDDQIDIYAIGFQEIVDLNMTSFVLQQNWEEKEMYWTNYVNEILLNARNFKGRKYKQVKRIRLFGLYLVVYAEVTLCEKTITEIYSGYVASGIMNMGNKGSVAVSFKLFETRFCFVCSHFAAHTEHLEKRNADFRITKQQLKFQDEKNPTTLIELDQHDTIFWFGDLNYRIDAISLNDTLKHIQFGAFDELIKFDQLTNERMKSKVFQEYTEGQIKFRPTFKYIIKSDMYEKQVQIQNGQNMAEIDAIGKVKLPSWTDRVLWKSAEKCELLQYSCVNTVTVSDHKPVYALFSTCFKKINEVKLKKVVEKIHKETDKKMNEEMPHIALDNKELKFGECMFYDVKVLQLSIKNDGLTRCNVEILFHDPEAATLEHHNDTNYVMRRHPIKTKTSNQWVSIFPQYKEKIPPNTTYNIELSTCFSNLNLTKINKRKSVEDFLVIKCVNGNHLFASLSCAYKPTILGFSLKCLTTIKPNDSFELCDQDNLINVVEADIQEHELHVDLCLSTNRREVTRTHQLKQIPTLSAIHTGGLPQASALDSSIAIFQESLYRTKEIIIEKDNYFGNDLSEEYQFFMRHLIKRCEKTLERLDKLDSKTTDYSELSVEEQKNLVISYLSTRNYADFENFNFDFELLAQVLNDALNALPQPLIPFRYADFCSFTDSKYDEAIKLFFYLPKSNLMLFELIVKFLQIYSDCLTVCASEENLNKINFHKTFADAIFQNVKKSVKNDMSTRFLSLFIFNHKNFQTI